MNPSKAIATVFLTLLITVSDAVAEGQTFEEEDLGALQWRVPSFGDSVVRVAQETSQRPELVRGNRKMWAAKRSNVRSGPGTEHAKVGLLEVGQLVLVTGKIGDWLKIQKGRGYAFVYAPLLTSTPPGGIRRTETSRAQAPARRQNPAAQQDRRTIRYTNARYEGDVRNGKEHGRGTMTWNDGRRYEGQWRNGKEHGRGTKTWTNGDRYEGDFLDGKPAGRGTYTRANGDRYEGDFINGSITGQGIYTWANGDRHEGGFVNGKRSGRGTSVFANGNVVRGVWASDELLVVRSWEEGEPQRREAISSSHERWGAYITTSSKDGSQVYAIVWDYPSRQAAMASLVERCKGECRRAGGCREYSWRDECDPSDDLVYRFSTSAPYQDDYNFQQRCFAVSRAFYASGTLGFYGAAGNSKAEAQTNARRISQAQGGQNIRIVETVCNSR